MTTLSRDDEQVVAATSALALDRVRTQFPSAAHLLTLCSFLGPDDIPRRLLLSGGKHLPLEFQDAVRDRGSLIAAVAPLRRYSLMNVNADALTMHRTVQASVRNALPDEQRETWATGAARVILAAFPDRPADARNWRWAGRLIRHAVVAADHLDELALAPALAGRLRDRLAEYMTAQGQLESAAANLRQAIARLESVSSERSLYASLLNRLAIVQREQGRFGLAEQDAQRALAIHHAMRSDPAVGSLTSYEEEAELQPRKGAAQAVEPAESTEIAEDLQTLGEISRLRKKYKDAKSYLDRALGILERTRGPHDISVADILASRFGLYLEADLRGPALDDLTRAVEIQIAVFGADDDEVLINQGLISMLSEPQQSDQTAREVFERLRSAYGPRHPTTAIGARILAAVLRQLGEFDEARRTLSEVLEIDRGNYGPNHFAVARDLVALMLLEAVRGDPPAAESRLREALAIVRTTPREERVTTLHLSDLETTLIELASYDPTRPLVLGYLEVAEDALSHDEDAVNAVRLMAADPLLVAGDAVLRSNRRDEAEAIYHEGLRLALLTAETEIDDANFHFRLGVVRAMSVDMDRAVDHFRTGLRFLDATDIVDPAWTLVGVCTTIWDLTGRSRHVEDALAVVVQEALEEGTMSDFGGSLTGAVPEGWYMKQSTTLLAADGKANVIASSEPLQMGIDTEKYAEVQGDMLRTPGEFPDYEETTFEAVRMLGNRSAYLRQFEWTPPDGVRVTQIQIYYVENGRGYTATATTPTSEFADRELPLRQIMRALRIPD